MGVITHHPDKYFDFSIAAISRTLSRIPRFNGHGDYVLTVGQHLIHCHYLAKRLYPLRKDFHQQALFHDVPEALYGDIISPVKHNLGDQAQHVLWTIDREIYEKFKVPWPTKEQKSVVKKIDHLALVLEAEYVFDCFQPEDWPTPELELPEDYDDFYIDMEPENVQYELEQLIMEYTHQ